MFSLPDAISKILEKHIKRADKQMMLDLPVVSSSPIKTETDVQIEEKVVETISKDQIKTNGTLTYKTTQKVSIANLGNAPVCPSCANMLLMAEGCRKCEMCGYSKCG